MIPRLLPSSLGSKTAPASRQASRATRSPRSSMQMTPMTLLMSLTNLAPRLMMKTSAPFLQRQAWLAHTAPGSWTFMFQFASRAPPRTSAPTGQVSEYVCDKTNASCSSRIGLRLQPTVTPHRSAQRVQELVHGGQRVPANCGRRREGISFTTGSPKCGGQGPASRVVLRLVREFQTWARLTSSTVRLIDPHMMVPLTASVEHPRRKKPTKDAAPKGAQGVAAVAPPSPPPPQAREPRPRRSERRTKRHPSRGRCEASTGP